MDKVLIEIARWQAMTMLFEVWESCRCKDQAAACASLGEGREGDE